MTKEAYYFSHDSNARHDAKIVRLGISAQKRFGSDLAYDAAYGVYFKLLEVMKESSDCRLEQDVDVLKVMTGCVSSDLLSFVISEGIEIGLFESKPKANEKQNESTLFWSKSFLNRQNLRKTRSEAGRKGGRPKANRKQNESLKERKGKERKESKGNKPSARAREAGDVEVDELMVEFCKMKAPDLDVDVFLDYFKLRCKEEPSKYNYSDYRMAFQRWCLTEQKRISDGEGSQFAKAARKENQSGPSFYDSAEFRAGNKILDDDLKRFKEEQARRLSA